MRRVRVVVLVSFFVCLIVGPLAALLCCDTRYRVASWLRKRIAILCFAWIR
jgi:hypothetical protein